MRKSPLKFRFLRFWNKGSGQKCIVELYEFNGKFSSLVVYFRPPSVGHFSKQLKFSYPLS